MLSNEGDKIKLIMTVEVVGKWKVRRGFDVKLPDGRIISIDEKKYVDTGLIQIEE